MVWHRLAIACAALGTALPSAATTYCCTDDNGHKVCGDVLPSQCLRRPYQELGAQGTVLKQHSAPLTAEQKAQRDAELAQKKAEERKAADEDRRNRALLASYASIKDIDAKRDRNLHEAESVLHNVQERYDAALERRAELRKDADFYVKQPMPDVLKAKIRENEADISGHQAAIEERKKDIAEITGRFEEERQRYLKLSTQRQGATAAEPPR